MVEKITINPERVRGLGNIISPSKTVDDFTAYNSTITSTTELINKVSTVVYNLTADVGGIVLTVTQLYVASSDTVVFTATVHDEQGAPVEDAEVKFYSVEE